MARSEPSHLVVGHINKAHGTRGELFVWPLTDHPESTFASGVLVFLASEGGERPDPSQPVLTIEGVRPFRRGYLVRFAGVADRTQAEALRGRYLLRPRNELREPEEGEVFYHQLLGMRVVTTSGEELGEIVEVYELHPADLLEIRGPRGLIHLPFLASLVRSTDPEEGLMIVEPPEGLLETG